ncbi:TRZ/ATZ family hydrolase [Methylophilaceae bacterium]|nr:TRZ/ATZ family hydrolase [Methylophilaceae bacterium]
MIKKVNSIISASWIFTADKNNTLLEDHSIVILEDEILDILPTKNVFEGYEANEVFALSEHIIMPGFINNHTHAAMSLLKGFANDVPLKSWLEDYIWPAEKEYVSEAFVKDGSLIAIAEMIKSGTTTFNDMYFYPNQTAEAAVEMGIRANIGLVVMEFPTNYASDPDDYLKKGLDFRDQWRGDGLISTSLAPHAPYTTSDKTLNTIGTYADQLNMTIHTHLHETKEEVENSINQYKATPIQRYKSLGLLGPNLMAAHCTHVDESDLNLLHQNNVNVVHNPSSNLILGSGIADISKMLDLGINVSIGTDSSASNNRLDVLEEVRLAALLGKGLNHQPETLDSKNVFKMATYNAAKAMNKSKMIGSIEPNKKADIVAINLDSIFSQPVYNPLTSLLYNGNQGGVDYVWINGTIKLKSGQLENIDLDRLKNIAKSWKAKIKKT